MYIPAHFAETDSNRLFDFMEQHGFATLISLQGTEPFASHLPLTIDRQSGPQGRIWGHMARANPQWQTADGQRVLAIFHGPHTYISPTWYRDQQVVPTWNYVVVHAYGTFRVDQDDRQILQRVRQLVAVYEAGLPNPWSIESQDRGFVDRMLKAIVGFEIELDRIEGKWKLNQNHSSERREHVIETLRELPNADARLIADWMADLKRGRVGEGESGGGRD